ncbi:hypothetical protein [Nocardioides sp. WS12]|uniref:hypothetical protein n=1 Tax=Nocardioides sp. WS12 TaxID=2486272 RepID=UPI0015F7DE8D|nr:hypothetical protein [Nocardioides sp. WS12]
MNLHSRRTPAVLALLLAGTALFTGCTDNGSPAEAKDKATSTATSDPTSTPSTPDELVILPGSIGAARVGMTRAQWTPTGLFEDGAVLCGGELIHWAADPTAEKLLVLTDKDATITQLFVSAPGPHTEHGDIEVGSTYGELKRAFPAITQPVADGFGETSSVYPPSEEDGLAYLGFLLNALPGDVTDATTIARIAVTGGEKPYFQYGC